jgi:hypothetical protein
MRISATLLAATAALGAAMFAGQAVAQPTAYYQFGPGVPPSATDHLDLPLQVTATVSPGCGFTAGQTPDGNFVHNNFDLTGFTDTVNFQLNCNGPFRLAVASASGGMQGPAAAVPAGYANLADYNVALHIVANAGGPFDINCNASQLKTAGGGCDTANANGFRGTATTTEGYRVISASQGQAGTYIRLTRAIQPTSPILVNGTYTDTLIVTVSAAP